MPVLQVHNLSKTYTGGVQALTDVSLDIGSGIFGLLGRNGAGKTTLMRTLATLQQPDQGKIQLDDIDLLDDPQSGRHQIGYLPQDMGVYPLMSAYESLAYFAGLKGLAGSADVMQALDEVNLADVADQRLDTFSGGMRRRFGIAVAFLGKPKLVIVDEPTAGLDPFERRRFQHLLTRAAQDCVLILSSHIVEDVENLATQMAILNAGRIIATGTPETLISELVDRVWTREIGFDELDRWQSSANLLSWRPRYGGHQIRVLADSAPGPGFTAVAPDLEDLYAQRLAAT